MGYEWYFYKEIEHAVLAPTIVAHIERKWPEENALRASELMLN